MRTINNLPILTRLTILLSLFTLTACVRPSPSIKFCVDQGGRYESRSVTEDTVQSYCIFPDNTECIAEAFYRGACQPGTPPTPVPGGAPLLEYTARYTDTTLGIAFPYLEYWSVRMSSAGPALMLSRDADTEFRVEVMPDQAGVVDPEVMVETIRQREAGLHIKKVDPITIDEQPAFLIQLNAFSRPETVSSLFAVVATPCGQVLDSYEQQVQAVYLIVEQPLIISARGIELPLFEELLQHVKLRDLSPAC